MNRMRLSEYNHTYQHMWKTVLIPLFKRRGKDLKTLFAALLKSQKC